MSKSTMGSSWQWWRRGSSGTEGWPSISMEQKTSASLMAPPSVDYCCANYISYTWGLVDLDYNWRKLEDQSYCTWMQASTPHYLFTMHDIGCEERVIAVLPARTRVASSIEYILWLKYSYTIHRLCSHSAIDEINTFNPSHYSCCLCKVIEIKNCLHHLCDLHPFAI